MDGLIRADDQPIMARWGDDAVWLTSYVTPQNPTVELAYQSLTKNISSQPGRIDALWRYVSHMPYSEVIASTLSAGGKSIHQKDTWFFPAETMVVGRSNCANRSFLMASLLKNELPDPGQVYVSIGTITLDGIGNHAWVTVDSPGGPYIIETTQPNLDRAFIPMSAARAYDAKLHFDEHNVYTSVPGINPQVILDRHFGVCAIGFLHNYLCEHCLGLGNPGGY